MGNYVIVSGAKTGEEFGQTIISWTRQSGVQNEVMVAGLPRNMAIGQKITILGELCNIPVGLWSTKFALGVRFSQFIRYSDQNYAVFSGVIYYMAQKIKNTRSGKKIIEFTVLVGNNTYVNCIAWNGYAEVICQYFIPGDHISVEGLLLSRKYKKEINGRYEVKTTTEISVIHMIKE